MRVLGFDISIKREHKQAGTFFYFFHGMGPVWTPRNYRLLAKAGYENCGTVYACVNMIARAAAGIPWLLYEEKADGELEEITRHPLLDLIRRPNPLEGQARFIERTLSYLLLGGNSYPLLVGPKWELWSLPPDRWEVLPGNSVKPIAGYRYKLPGQDPQDFMNNEVLHLKLFHSTNDFYGLSPIEVIAKEIDIQAMAKEWNAKLLQNDCRPPGAFVAKGNLDDQQYEDLKAEIKREYLGYAKAGLPLLLEGDIDWKQFALTPRDMDHLRSDKVTTRKICVVFNVAPELIGDSDNKTFSNYQEGRKALYLENVLPLMDWLRDELNNWLTPRFGKNLKLDYDRDEIEALQEDRQKVYERMEKAWWLRLDEKRDACGYEAVGGPEGEAIYIPSGLVPLSTFGENTEEE